MKPLYLQLFMILFIILYLPLEILLTPKRHGIKHRSHFAWTLLMSLISISTLGKPSIHTDTKILIFFVGIFTLFVTFSLIEKHFSGQVFKVAELDGFDLTNAIKKAVEANGFVIEKVAFNQATDKTTYEIADCNKSISFELKEKITSDERFYCLSFIRWADRGSKNAILDAISEDMSSYEIPKKRKKYLLLEMVLFMMGVLVLLGVINSRMLG